MALEKKEKNSKKPLDKQLNKCYNKIIKRKEVKNMKEKEFYIDFSGYCLIKAKSAKEAEEKFWKGLQVPSKETYDDVYDIDSIEEKN